MNAEMVYKQHYDAIMELPAVKQLLKENRRLRKKNKDLRGLIRLLPEFRQPSCCRYYEVHNNHSSVINANSEEVFIKKEPIVKIDDEVVIIDMEAGLEHLGRGSTEHVDALVIVVEPGQRSIGTAKQIKKLGEDLKIKKIMIVGNKVGSDDDRRIIEENLSDFQILGHMSYNPKVLQADREGRSPYDIDDRIKEEVKGILTELEKRI